MQQVDTSKVERVLIIDHNIMRFHHYDLMESLISHPPICELLKEDYQLYLTMDRVGKLRFLKNSNTRYNILDFFDGDFTTEDYVEMFSKMINYSNSVTPMNMYFGLDTLTRMNNLDVTIFKLPGDIEYEEGLLGPRGEIVIRDDIFSVDSIADYITRNGINLLICDSLDMAIDVGLQVETPMLFSIPKYGFNVDIIENDMRVFRRIEDLMDLGKAGHTVGAFDPLVLL